MGKLSSGIVFLFWPASSVEKLAATDMDVGPCRNAADDDDDDEVQKSW